MTGVVKRDGWPAVVPEATKTVTGASLVKVRAAFHLAPACGPCGGPEGSGLSMYQQFESSHSSPRYSAMHAATPPRCSISTSPSYTTDAPHEASHERTDAACECALGHTVTTTAEGERRQNSRAARAEAEEAEEAEAEAAEAEAAEAEASVGASAGSVPSE